MRLIVGISGADGVILGYRLLQALRKIPDMEIHLVVTEGAAKNFEYETDLSLDQVARLADVVHDNRNMAASISSGSFETDGMIVIPCSMKTLSGIVNGPRPAGDAPGPHPSEKLERSCGVRVCHRPPDADVL